MTVVKRLHLLAAIALVTMLAACTTSPTPVLYTIAPVPGAAQGGGPYVVSLQQIGLTEYLQRLPIVRSSDGYKIDLRANDWWGEPLNAMLSRVLVEELGQRLPQSVVVSENGALTTSPDASVAVNVQRLDQDASQQLVLIAQGSVDFRGKHAPVLRNFRIAVPMSGADTPAEVAAISAAVGQLADGIAAMLVEGPGR
jgi:uncharacterized lipoprotein YmbA